MQSNSPGRFVGVQALRGVAAMLVVVAHATQMIHERMGVGKPLYFGASGVDIFFPISGFVMVVTTYKHWGKAGHARDFLLRRLIRILPLYWAATLLKIVATLALPSVVSHPHLDPWHVAASFLFIPAWDADHKPFPLVPVGWTLHFEMFFYVLFFIALALRLRPVWWLGFTLLVVSCTPRPDFMGAVGALLDPILMEFVAGMFIGWATVTGRTIPATLAWWSLALSFVALAATQMLPESVGFTYRVALWGVPGSCALLAVLALEAPLKQLLSGWPEKFGDASYAIYITHGFVLPAVGLLFLKARLTDGAWPACVVITGSVLSVIAGLVVHYVFEQPVVDALTRFRRSNRRESVKPAL